jgi:dienelactone hydrolase
MTLSKQIIRYDVGGVTFESLAVWDDAVAGKRPAVLVAPTFKDKSPFEEQKAEALAALGYVGFAIDIYGVDIQPQGMEDAFAAMQVLNDNRAALRARMEAALAQVRALDVTDPAKVSAIGYCFGGKCVIDLARAGADVRAVIAFHGLFDPPAIPVADVITARVLALHGWDDSSVPPDQVVAFATEMTAKKAAWELHAYGHTVHGFTNYNRPEAYDETADRHSWRAATAWLAEAFG